MTPEIEKLVDPEAGRAASQPGSHEPSPDGLGPSGFDPSRGKAVTCVACCGAGIVSVWSFGVKEPEECSGCGGSGLNWRYPGGAIARHYAGPLIGRDSDGSPKGGDAEGGSVHDSAGLKGIAQPDPALSNIEGGERG